MRLRAVSLTLVVCFLAQDLAFAAPEISQMLSARPLPSLPAGSGFIEDSYTGSPSSPTVYLIQDAHINESAQIHIASILEALGKSGVELVFLEAGTGDDSLSFLREAAPAAERLRVAKSFLKKGYIQGPDFLDLTSDLPLSLWGVEDKALYRESLEAYRFVRERREHSRAYLRQMQRTIEALKPRFLHPVLAALEEKRQAGLKGDLPLTDTLDALMREARANRVRLQPFHQLAKFEEIRSLESTIDFGRASAEQNEALAALPESTRAEFEALAQVSPDRSTEASEERANAFYSALADKLDKKTYPSLSRYLDYREKARALKTPALWQEKKELERLVYYALAPSGDERSLVEAIFAVETLSRLVGLELMAEDYEEIRSDPERFNATEIAAFLNRLILDLNERHEEALFVDDVYGQTSERALRFYALTFERDRHFVRAMTDKAGERGHKAFAFVGGGYHTGHLKKLLRERDASYVSIMPQVNGETNIIKYENLLLGGSPSGGAVKSDTIAVPPARELVTPSSSTPVVNLLSEAFSAAIDPSQQKVVPAPNPVKRLYLRGLDVARLSEKVAELKKELSSAPFGLIELRYDELFDVEWFLANAELSKAFEKLQQDDAVQVVLLPQQQDMDRISRYRGPLDMRGIILLPFSDNPFQSVAGLGARLARKDSFDWNVAENLYLPLKEELELDKAQNLLELNPADARHLGGGLLFPNLKNAFVLFDNERSASDFRNFTKDHDFPFLAEADPYLANVGQMLQQRVPGILLEETRKNPFDLVVAYNAENLLEEENAAWLRGISKLAPLLSSRGRIAFVFDKDWHGFYMVHNAYARHADKSLRRYGARYVTDRYVVYTLREAGLRSYRFTKLFSGARLAGKPGVQKLAWMPGDPSLSIEKRHEILKQEIFKAGGIAAYERANGINESTVKNYLQKHRVIRDAISAGFSFPEWFPGKAGQNEESRIQLFLEGVARYSTFNQYALAIGGARTIYQFLAERPDIKERAEQLLFPAWMPEPGKTRTERLNALAWAVNQAGGIREYARQNGMDYNVIYNYLERQKDVKAAFEESLKRLSGRGILSGWVIRPEGSVWKEIREEVRSLKGKDFGKTDSAGSFDMTPVLNFPLKWRALGFREAGWDSSVIDSDVVRGLPRFTVEFTKEGHRPFRRRFVVGTSRRELSGVGLARGSREDVWAIESSEEVIQRILVRMLVEADRNKLRSLARNLYRFVNEPMGFTNSNEKLTFPIVPDVPYAWDTGLAGWKMTLKGVNIDQDGWPAITVHFEKDGMTLRNDYRIGPSKRKVRHALTGKTGSEVWVMESLAPRLPDHKNLLEKIANENYPIRVNHKNGEKAMTLVSRVGQTVYVRREEEDETLYPHSLGSIKNEFVSAYDGMEAPYRASKRTVAGLMGDVLDIYLRATDVPYSEIMNDFERLRARVSSFLSPQARRILEENIRNRRLFDADALTVLHGLALLLAENARRGDPPSSAEMKKLQSVIDAYNSFSSAHPLENKGQMTVPLLFLLVFSNHYHASYPGVTGVRDAWVSMARQLPSFPGEHGFRLTALNLVSLTMRLNNIKTREDLETVSEEEIELGAAYLHYALDSISNGRLKKAVQEEVRRFEVKKELILAVAYFVSSAWPLVSSGVLKKTKVGVRIRKLIEANALNIAAWAAAAYKLDKMQMPKVFVSIAVFELRFFSDLELAYHRWKGVAEPALDRLLLSSDPSERRKLTDFLSTLRNGGTVDFDPRQEMNRQPRTIRELKEIAEKQKSGARLAESESNLEWATVLEDFETILGEDLRATAPIFRSEMNRFLLGKIEQARSLEKVKAAGLSPANILDLASMKNGNEKLIQTYHLIKTDPAASTDFERALFYAGTVMDRLGRVTRRRDDFAAAAVLIEAAYAIRPSEATAIELATVYHHMDRYADAEALLQPIVDSPDAPRNALNTLGYVKLGEAHELYRQFEQALSKHQFGRAFALKERAFRRLYGDAKIGFRRVEEPYRRAVAMGRMTAKSAQVPRAYSGLAAIEILMARFEIEIAKATNRASRAEESLLSAVDHGVRSVFYGIEAMKAGTDDERSFTHSLGIYGDAVTTLKEAMDRMLVGGISPERIPELAYHLERPHLDAVNEEGSVRGVWEAMQSSRAELKNRTIFYVEARRVIRQAMTRVVEEDFKDLESFRSVLAETVLDPQRGLATNGSGRSNTEVFEALWKELKLEYVDLSILKWTLVSDAAKRSADSVAKDAREDLTTLNTSRDWRFVNADFVRSRFRRSLYKDLGLELTDVEPEPALELKTEDIDRHPYKLMAVSKFRVEDPERLASQDARYAVVLDWQSEDHPRRMERLRTLRTQVAEATARFADSAAALIEESKRLPGQEVSKRLLDLTVARKGLEGRGGYLSSLREFEHRLLNETASIRLKIETGRAEVKRQRQDLQSLMREYRFEWLEAADRTLARYEEAIGELLDESREEALSRKIFDDLMQQARRVHEQTEFLSLRGEEFHPANDRLRALDQTMDVVKDRDIADGLRYQETLAGLRERFETSVLEGDFRIESENIVKELDEMLMKANNFRQASLEIQKLQKALDVYQNQVFKRSDIEGMLKEFLEESQELWRWEISGENLNRLKTNAAQALTILTDAKKFSIQREDFDRRQLEFEDRLLKSSGVDLKDEEEVGQMLSKARASLEDYDNKSFDDLKALHLATEELAHDLEAVYKPAEEKLQFLFRQKSEGIAREILKLRKVILDARKWLSEVVFLNVEPEPKSYNRLLDSLQGAEDSLQKAADLVLGKDSAEDSKAQEILSRIEDNFDKVLRMFTGVLQEDFQNLNKTVLENSRDIIRAHPQRQALVGLQIGVEPVFDLGVAIGMKFNVHKNRQSEARRRELTGALSQDLLDELAGLILKTHGNPYLRWADYDDSGVGPYPYLPLFMGVQVAVGIFLEMWKDSSKAPLTDAATLLKISFGTAQKVTQKVFERNDGGKMDRMAQKNLPNYYPLNAGPDFTRKSLTERLEPRFALERKVFEYLLNKLGMNNEEIPDEATIHQLTLFIDKAIFLQLNGARLAGVFAALSAMIPIFLAGSDGLKNEGNGRFWRTTGLSESGSVAYSSQNVSGVHIDAIKANIIGDKNLEIVPYAYFGKNGDTKASLSDIIQKFESENHGMKVLGAVNGGFFDDATGISIGFLLRDSEIEFFNIPMMPRSMMGFVKASEKSPGKFLISSPKREDMPKYWLTIPKDAKEKNLSVHGVNVPRPRDSIIVYTPVWGKTTQTNDSGIEIVVKLGKNGVSYVSEIRVKKGNSTIPTGGFVVSLHGSQVKHAALFKPDDTKKPAQPVEVNRRWSLPAQWQKENVASGLLAGPRVSIDGKTVINSARTERLSGSHMNDPRRVVIGKTEDGKVVMALLNKLNGGNLSFGEAGKLLGLRDVLFVDGGTSSSIHTLSRSKRLETRNGRQVTSAILLVEREAKKEPSEPGGARLAEEPGMGWNPIDHLYTPLREEFGGDGVERVLEVEPPFDGSHVFKLGQRISGENRGMTPIFPELDEVRLTFPSKSNVKAFSDLVYRYGFEKDYAVSGIQSPLPSFHARQGGLYEILERGELRDELLSGGRFDVLTVYDTEPLFTDRRYAVQLPTLAEYLTQEGVVVLLVDSERLALRRDLETVALLGGIIDESSVIHDSEDIHTPDVYFLSRKALLDPKLGLKLNEALYDTPPLRSEDVLVQIFQTLFAKGHLDAVAVRNVLEFGRKDWSYALDFKKIFPNISIVQGFFDDEEHFEHFLGTTPKFYLQTKGPRRQIGYELQALRGDVFSFLSNETQWQKFVQYNGKYDLVVLDRPTVYYDNTRYLAALRSMVKFMHHTGRLMVVLEEPNPNDFGETNFVETMEKITSPLTGMPVGKRVYLIDREQVALLDGARLAEVQGTRFSSYDMSSTGFARKGPLSLAKFEAERSLYENAKYKISVPERKRLLRVLQVGAVVVKSWGGVPPRLIDRALKRVADKNFKIYAIPEYDISDEDYLRAYFDAETETLFVSKHFIQAPANYAYLDNFMDVKLLKELIFPARRVAVIGATGYIGTGVFQALEHLYPGLIGTSHTRLSLHPQLDVTNDEEVRDFMQQHQPDVIVYASGQANPAQAEDNPGLTYDLNVNAIRKINQYFNGRLIYFSSDYVFDGENAPYTPDSAKNPLNFYGRTKDIGEQEVLSRPDNVVIRLSLVYGGGPSPRDFLTRVVGALNEGKRYDAEAEQLRYPISLDDVEDLVLTALSENRSGVLQLNGPDAVTRYIWARLIAKTYYDLFPFRADAGKTTEEMVDEKIGVYQEPPNEIEKPSGTKMENSDFEARSLKEEVFRLVPLLTPYKLYKVTRVVEKDGRVLFHKRRVMAGKELAGRKVFLVPLKEADWSAGFNVFYDTEKIASYVETPPQKTDGARLSQLQRFLSRVAGVKGRSVILSSRLPLELEKTAIFSFKENNGSLIAEAEGLEPIVLSERAAPLALEAASHTKPALQDLRTLHDAAWNAVETSLSAVDIDTARPVIAEIDLNLFNNRSFSFYLDLLVEELHYARTKPYGKNAYFRFVGDPERLQALELSSQVSALLPPDGLKDAAVVQLYSAGKNASRDKINVPTQVLTEGDVPAFRAMVHLTLAAGQMNLKDLPEGFQSAYATLAGRRPEKAVLASILDGSAAPDIASSFALKPLVRVAINEAVNFFRLMRKQLEQSA